MSRKQIVMIAVALMTLAALIGCGNDDCTSCPETVKVLGHARGSLQLLPAAYMPALHVFSDGAVAPNLDSLKVGDSLVDKLFWTVESDLPFGDAHLRISFLELGDTSNYMYKHGDLATITAWGQGRSSVCRLKVFNSSTAAAHVTHPFPNFDTIAVNGADTIFWNKVEHVDYYAVMIAWYVFPPGQYKFAYYYSTDTSFVVNESIWPAGGVMHLNVHITPFGGPDPRTGRSNWTGNLLDGVVYSIGEQSSTTVQVEQLITAPNGPGPASLEAPPAPSADEIVAAVYDKYWPSR